MASQQSLPKVPNIQFRVLVIGKANAGKTSILQRVCDTTESPEVYRPGPRGTRERVELNPTTERGEHSIEHELIFSHHEGYVFHDSRGFEGGSDDELKIVQDFVRRRSQEGRLKDRLHAIWYCVPMDSARPSLELKYFEDICPDKNVPVIAVFTKFDQFRKDTRMKLEDQDRDADDPAVLNAEMERIFNKEFLTNLKGSPPIVRLERMHKFAQRCTDLIETTANALSGGAVALILLTIQKNNLELNINRAVKWAHSTVQQSDGSTESVIKWCILAFPSIWYPECRPDLKSDETIYGEYWGELSSGSHLSKREVMTVGESSSSYFKQNNFKEPTNAILSKLCSFCANPPLLTSSDDNTHHKLIATILILEHACFSYASHPKPTRDQALDQAYSQYCTSHVHDEVMKQFFAPAKEYSIVQLTEFILKHRL